MKVKVTFPKRGISLFFQVGRVRGRIGTWVYWAPFPGNEARSKAHGGSLTRTGCAWLER